MIVIAQVVFVQAITAQLQEAGLNDAGRMSTLPIGPSPSDPVVAPPSSSGAAARRRTRAARGAENSALPFTPLYELWVARHASTPHHRVTKAVDMLCVVLKG